MNNERQLVSVTCCRLTQHAPLEFTGKYLMVTQRGGLKYLLQAPAGVPAGLLVRLRSPDEELAGWIDECISTDPAHILPTTAHVCCPRLLHMSTVHVYHRFLLFMFPLHVYFSMSIAYVYLSCPMSMSTLHVCYSCLLHKFFLHVYSLCLLSLYISSVHVYFSCLLPTYTVHVYCSSTVTRFTGLYS